MKRTEKVKSRTFLEEEKEDEEQEMPERFSCQGKWVSEQRAFPREIDDDDWKVGAWKSATGIFKIVRGGEAAARRKRGLSREESSFQSLDLRAAEVLDRSMQALESSTSLTSCAFGMMTDYPHWEGGGIGWEVEKGDQEVVGRSHDWDPSECVHSCDRGGLTTTVTTKPKAYHGCEHDRARVLKEMVSSNIDYNVKVSTTAAKNSEDSIERMPVKNLNVLNFKENTFEEGQLGHYSRGKLWNGSPIERAVGGGQELPSPLSRDDISMKGAHEDGGQASADKTTDAINGTATTLDRLTQTTLTGLSGCKMLPPKGKRSGGDLRLPTRPNGEQLQRNVSSVASQRRKKRSLKNYHSEQRKLTFPSKPPKWKGLSTALSVMRSMCHGAGEAGVVEAQARPLLIVAGKCVFRTTAPLDTPRLCTILHQRKCHLPRASSADDESLPPPRSADVSSEDTRKASSHSQPASKPWLPIVTSFNDPPSTIPCQNKCQSTSSTIKPWPAVLTELDNWISQIVNEWLDKDDHLAAGANSSRSHTSVTVGNPITVGIFSEEKARAFGVPPVANITEFPSRLSKSLSETLAEQGQAVSTQGKQQTELDSRIGQAQTVHDLSQLLEPISQPSISSISDNKVARGIKISPISIIQEFGDDDVVQEFQRQIVTLERQNEDLKSSLWKEEQSDLFRRLETLNI